ncbi:MAG: IGHMBP2 family helicase [Aquificae bacterium]|nr:IGHMBP2 family helicase [Aquificota bacterium]
MKLKFKNTDEYINHFLELIQLEREAEKEFHLNEIKNLTGKEREKKGRAILKLKGKYVGEMLGGFKIYRFYREDMPEHQIKVGDVVLISKKNPLKSGIEGTVLDKGKNFISVTLKQEIKNIEKGYWRVDLFVNDVTFKRMVEALYQISIGKSLFPVEFLLGEGNPYICEEKLEHIENKNLNQYQKEAVKKAVCSYPIFLIHGPPGTGKTTTLVEAIIQSVKKGEKVLATADSNTAVDNIIEGLLKYDINIVRIGHPARLRKELLNISLDYKVQEHKDYTKLQQIIKKINQLKQKQEEYLKPIPKRRRGLSYEEIVQFAQAGLKIRGIKIKKLKDMAKWIEIQKQLKKLFKERDKIEKNIIRELLNDAQVICATNSSTGGEFLKDKKFDVVFIDEASQATEPSCLIPMVKAKKAVLAGDHKQLPPTVLNPKAKDLTFTLFERFIKLYPEASYMLRVQYRMNDKIKEFPSREFYNNLLISAETVKDIKLSDLTGKKYTDPIINDVPIVFVDTKGEFPEKTKKGSKSKYNPKEAKLVKQVVEKLLKAGIKPEDIGVITPYKDHEEYLKNLIKDVEIHTVDGFQGREKEVIIISLVRSNPQEEIGFLDDTRRLNVAITRAKRKLIIIGDMNTLIKHSIYKKLIEYIKKEGQIVDFEQIGS